MTAIVSGDSLGLGSTSLATLGRLAAQDALSSATQGRNREQAVVNVSTGNLVLQDRDDLLVGRGLDIESLRTYNSQGLLDDDNADNWRVGAFGQTVRLASGSAGGAGSTVVRTERDGGASVYTWNATRSLYVGTDGAGAYDTIGFDAGAAQFVWTDGDSGRIERFQSGSPGRLVSASDPNGNTVTLGYDAAGRPTSMVAANGDTQFYDYSGSDLSRIRTVSGGTTTTTVRYGYDSAHRLVRVTVDLTPEDNAVADGKVYETTYAYDGTSRRVARIDQTDGTSLAFTYVQDGAAFKVASVTDALGAVTRFAYDRANGITTVTDALGGQSTWRYDTQGRLTELKSGIGSARPQGLTSQRFVYDADGNVTQITDGTGHTLSVQYDANGNAVREVDSAGDTRVRSYGSANQLLTDTVYADAAVHRGAFDKAAALPESTRLVYANANPRQLRFSVGAAGSVTEYRYDGNGLRTASIVYTGASFDVSTLAPGAALTEAQLLAWVQARDGTQTQRTDFAYDARGELTSRTTYAANDASGNGQLTGAAVTRYVRDARGLLLQQIESDGAVAQITYDGMGRELSRSAPSRDAATPNLTLTQYDDAGRSSTVVLANGLVTLSAYDRAGRLIGVTQSSQGTGVLGTTRYAYDAVGHLLMTTDPTGARRWSLYDAAGRDVATIDATGAMVENVFDASGRLRQTIAYATRIDTARLVDINGLPTTAASSTSPGLTLASLRPAASSDDRKTWRFYDAANRLAWEVDAAGYATQTTYDGASRVLAVTRLANAIDVGALEAATAQGMDPIFAIDPSQVGGLVLQASTAAPSFGTALTLTATLATLDTSGAAAGGMVSFFDGDTLIGSAPVVDGKASFTTAALALGAHAIRAAYSGDADRAASLSASSSISVTPALTQARIALSPAVATYGVTATISATLSTPDAPTLAAATGRVTFYNGNTVLGSANAVNGVAQINYSTLSGALSIRIVYAGDATHAPLTTTVSLGTAAPRQTVTTLIPPSAGTGGVLTASVLGGWNLQPVSGGTVTFYSGTTVIGTATAASGKASLALKTPPPAGPFKAVYGASSTHATSSSVAGPAASTTTLQVSAGALAGQTKLQARVTGASPSGLVSFFADTVYLGSASYVSGVATLTTSAIPVGTKALRAAYGGDANDRGSVSAAAAPLAGAAGTTVAPAPNVATTGIGIAASATAGAGYAAQITVTGLSANATGVLSLFDGPTLVGSYVGANGVFGTISSPALSAGTHALRVVYSGDATRPATSAAASITVPRSTPGLSLSSSNTSSVAGTAVTLVAALYLPNRTGYGGPAASGKVTFYNEGVSIGSANLVNGEARLTLTNLATGVANITAVYAGDTQFATATSNALNQIVAASAQTAASAASIEIVPQNAQAGTGASVRVRVAPTTGITATPVEGQVALYDGNRLLGTATLLAGVATFGQSLLPVGDVLLRAEYAGNASFAPSTNLVSTVLYQAPSRTTLSATPTSAAQGATVTLTATVSGTAPGGTVSFFAGTTFLGTATATAGRAVLTTQALPAGKPTVVATYSGDANNRSSVSTAGVSVTIGAGTLVAPPSVAAGGFTFGFVDATAGFANGVTTSLPASATGSLSFFDGQTLIGSLMLGTPGNRAIVLPTGGSRTLTAMYSGDATYAAASATQTVAVQQLTPQLTLGSNAQVSMPGAPLVLRAVVAPPASTGLGSDFAGAAATGKVSFSANGVVLGTGTLAAGVATLNLASLPAGTTAFSVSYAGDANYLAGTASFTQSVSTAQQTPAVSLAPLPARIGYGSSLALTASITSRGLPPGGTVRFYDGGTLIGSATLAQGTATLRIGTLAVGSHSISVSYAGDTGNVAASLPAPVRIDVAPAATTLSRQSAATIASDAAIRIAVGASSATGIVGLYDGQTLLATARVVAGVATLSGVRWPVGTRTVTAAYSGDTKNASAILRFTQTVTGQSPVVVGVQLDMAQDRTTTQFHDSQGRLQGTLDAEGYLTEYRYDAAGRLTETIAYATRASDFASPAERAAAVAVARASAKLTGLRPAASAQDIRTRTFYDARGQAVGQIDAEGYLTENIYDSRGQLVRSTRYARTVDALAASAANATLAGLRPASHPQDQTITQSWDAAGQLVSRTNAEGTVSQFSYDSVGQLVQTTTAVGTADAITSRARYDVQGRLVATLDGRGSDAVALGDPLSAWAAKGDSFSYDAAGRRTSSTDANGRRTLYFYDAESRLVFVVNPLGEVTQTVYDAFGGVAQQIVYGTRIDAPTLARSTAGGIALNAVGAAVAAVANAAKDSRTQFGYHVTGTLASRTDALGQVTRYDYDAFGDTTSSRRTLADGRQVTDAARFDRRGLQVARVQDADGLALTQSSRYDAFGRTVVDTDGKGQSDAFSYDRLGRLVGTQDAAGAFTSTRYDAFSRTVAQVDALGRTTTYAYDLQARSLRVTTPEGIVTTTVHDRLGRTTSLTDGLGNTTSYRYDKSGNLVEAKTPLTTTTSSYDAAGQQVQSVDANGITTVTTYDAAGRVLTRTLDPQGLALQTRTEYDAKGQAVRVTDPQGTVTTFDFDLEGRVLRQTVDAGGLALQTVYTHDTDGRTLSVTTPGGTLTRYSYDPAGRRTAEQVDPLGLNLTRRYAYDANGNVTQAIDANGNATLYTYDRENRLLFTLDAAGSLTQNRYDAVGRLVQRTRYTQTFTPAQLASAPPAIDAGVAAGTGLTTQWRYDGDGRLRFAVDPTGAVTRFSYDAAGNRVEELRYANRIDPARLTATSDPAPTADATRDQRVRTVYDALHRATWQVDATGAARQTVYDAAGHAIETRGYANLMSASALAAWNGRSAPTVTADAARDLRLRTVYDAAGRATWTVDGAGNVTRNSYDADGRLIEQRGHARALTAAALTAWNGKSAPPVQADDASDSRLGIVYDAAGRRSWTLDGSGAVVSYRYDGNGNEIARRAYARAIAPTTAMSAATLAAAVNAVGADDARDQQALTVYDAAGRATRLADGAGGLVQIQYDANGNVVDRREFATANGFADDAHDLHVRSAYDAANRIALRADGTGSVTAFGYDGAGRQVRSVQYARAIAANAALTSVAPSADDRVTVRSYDANDRLSFRVDALGAVTRQVYDAFGQLTQQVAYSRPIAPPDLSTTYSDAGIVSQLPADPSTDRVQRFAYDAAGHQVFAIDAAGAVTESAFDGNGLQVRSTRYAQPLSSATASGLSASASPADIRSRLVPDASRDRSTRTAYDAAGRAVFAVDALGFVTRSSYDGVDRQTATTRYARAIGSTVASTVSAIGTALVANAADRTSTQRFDAAGHRLSATDALGGTEQWGYDALGRVVTYTNANAAVWQYDHDAAGRLVREVSPQVEMLALTTDANGHLVHDPGSSGVGAVVTLLGYDALGQLRSRTEAAGRPEARTTTYDYDAAGRQVRVTHPPVGVYDLAQDDLAGNGATGLAARVETQRALFTLTTYDTFGNAIANVDTAGHWSYKTYDRSGALSFEIDALGLVTGYSRNAFGEATALTRYTGAIAIPAGQPFTHTQVNNVLDRQGTDRTLHTDFDRLGRAIQVTESPSYVYDSRTDSPAVAGKTTRNSFNAFGELVQVAMLADIGGNWNLSTRVFDRAGRQTATVDAMGYLSTDSYDANGNVTTHVEYANAVAGWNGTVQMGGWNGFYAGLTSITPPTASADDRRTTTTYDALDRKTSETRVNVEYSTDSSGTSVRGNLTTRHAYDAVGNLLSTTDALGVTTTSAYDALGRVASVARPAPTEFNDGYTTAFTLFHRDALGNVVVQSEAVADFRGNPRPIVQTFSRYDALGHLVQRTDAGSVDHYSSYNAQGLVAKEWQAVSDTDAQGNGLTRTLWRAYAYDAAGQQTHVYDPGTPSDQADYTLGGWQTSVVREHRPRASFVAGDPPDERGLPAILPQKGNVTVDVSNVVDRSGGQVQIDVTFTTYSFMVEGDGPDAVWIDVGSFEGAPKLFHREPARTLTISRPLTVFESAFPFTIADFPEAIASIGEVKVSQMAGTELVELWRGSLAEADGTDHVDMNLHIGGSSSGVRDTAIAFNAFGEVTSRSVGGETVERFDYDNAGRLWRTDAGDGVVKVALYDLQGRQTSDIRSAGDGRGNVDLSAFRYVEQVASLDDVRRTDMRYDAVGHLVGQTLAARLETQGGVSVRTGNLTHELRASSSYDPAAGWTGSNSVNLHWPSYLSGLGNGEVRVTLMYATRMADGSAGPVRTIVRRFDAADAESGALMNWLDADASGPYSAAFNGISSIVDVKVEKLDLDAQWHTVISKSGNGEIGKSLLFAEPADASTQVTIQIRPAGTVGTGGWEVVTIVNFGDAYRYDASGLTRGEYEYRVLTTLPPATEPTVAANGKLSLTLRPLEPIWLSTSFSVAADSFAWNSPGGGDTQTIRIRVAGSSGAWVEQPITFPQPGWSAISLAALSTEIDYEYEVLSRHAGEAGAYAHATGVFRRGTPDRWDPGVPATPASGYPHIDGIFIEPRIHRVSADESGNVVETTQYVVRFPVLPVGTFSGFFLQVENSLFPPTPLPIVPRLNDFGIPDGTWEINLSERIRLPQGTYRYFYQYVQGPIQVVAWATGALTVRSDGSMSMQDQTPAYDPGSPGTPGHVIPGAPYGHQPTAPSSPYALSESPELGGLVLQATTMLNGSNAYQRPEVLQTVDRWGNVLSISDPRSSAWVTTYRYNANDELIAQTQPTVTYAINGAPVANVAPTTQLYYDAMGRQVAVRDANGHVNSQFYDVAGHKIADRDALGHVSQHFYDTLGRKIVDVDARGIATRYAYDPLGRLITTTHAPVDVWGQSLLPAVPLRLGVQQITEHNTYDQAGRLIATTNGAGETIRYAYDRRGNLIRTTLPMGQQTLAAYDAQDRKTLEADPNAKVATWHYDSAGHLTRHSDIGRADYSYAYDHSGSLTAQANTRGQDLSFTHDAAGQLVRIDDRGTGQVTLYELDAAGRHTRETISQDIPNGKLIYQDNHIQYDALGRMTRTADERSVVQVAYDAVGNRTQVDIHLNDLLVEHIPQYFQYDAMNRQTVVDAVDANGTITASQGHRLTYDEVGNRVSDTSIAPHIVQRPDGSFAVENGATTQTYKYDAMNRLESAFTDGVLTDRRFYDAASRTLIDGPLASLNPHYAATHSVSLGALGTPILGHGNRYDPNGRLIEQYSFEYGISKFKTTYEYDAAGNVELEATWDPAAPLAQRTVTLTRNTVEAAETYRQAQSITTVTGPKGVLLQQGGVGYGYDTNGHLNAVGDSGQILNPNLRQHHFVNDLQGHALYAYYNNEQTPEQRINEQRQLVVNGEVLGRYGAAAGARKATGPTFTLQSDFGFGYAPIGTASLQTPKSYAVAAGDTLQGIAKAMYGDADLWYLIADANGLSSSADLRTGQILEIPAHVLSSNDVDTFKPYDPSGIVGNTSATLVDLPAPRGSDQCGGVGKIIVVVVAVVAAYFTAGASLQALGYASVSAAASAGASGFAALAVSGAAAGAVGSIASQAVGNAIGVQDGFSWKQVALAAVGGGISGGLGGFAPTGNAIADAVIRGAVSNAATQGIAVVTGLQDKFDWRGVVASAAGAGVGQAIAGPASSVFGDGAVGQFATRFTSSLAAGYTTAVLRGGRVSVTQVATDAFGNALGDSLAAANGQASNVPGPLSAAERADILGYFDDGPSADPFMGGAQGLKFGSGGFGLSASASALDDWSGQTDARISAAARQLNAAEMAASASGSPLSDADLAARKNDVERQVQLELLGQQARDESLQGAQLFQTGGPARGALRGIGSGGFELVRNGNWDAALNIGADPYGVLPDLAGLQQDMAKMSRARVESSINDMRQRITDAGLKNVPGMREALVVGADGVARNVPDYNATIDNLQRTYEDFTRDQRLRSTYGDNYQDLRVGKTNMTALEFEKRVLDVQQGATNRAYDKGVELIAKGDLPIKGDYARTLGNFIDLQVRTELRGFAGSEGINDSMTSNIWAVNRSIRSDLVEGRGIPDNRLGYNLFADTTLALKSGSTEQIMKWNAIRPEANYLMVRPTQIGGSYVIPRAAIQPYMPSRPIGRGL